MHSLIRHAQIASRQLARAAPFTTAFGDYFISEKAAVFRKRKGFSRNVREYHANAAGTNNGNCPEVSSIF
jgi:hypothetical protein